MNADSKADIAAANQGNNLAGVLVNVGGARSARRKHAAGTAPYGSPADLNGDGLPDLSTANLSSNTVSVWLNATPRTRLELRDGGGTVVAAGVPADNLTAAVNNFVAPATGTYYARVSGSGTGTYNLVVTRDAAFDTEANNSFATAQPLAGAQGALGAVGTIPLSAPTAVVPSSSANAEGDFGNGFPFHISAFGIPSMRYQQIYAGSQFGGGSGVIDKIRFRKDVNAGNFSASNIDVKINLSYAATSPTAPSTVFANNVGSGVVTVFDGLLNLSSTGSGTPNPFDIVIDIADLFNYNPAQGPLLVDVFMRNSPATTFFDAVGTNQSVTSRISATPVNDTTGSAFISGLRPGSIRCRSPEGIGRHRTANRLRLEPWAEALPVANNSPGSSCMTLPGRWSPRAPRYRRAERVHSVPAARPARTGCG